MKIPFDLLKNPERLKEQLGKIREEAAAITVEGSAGGKMVSIKMNAKFEVKEVHIDPICVDKRDVKMLEDLIVSAFNDATDKINCEIISKAGPILSELSEA